jgi:hypothetical protein
MSAVSGAAGEPAVSIVAEYWSLFSGPYAPPGVALRGRNLDAIFLEN